ncbi:hypothetical protein J4558_20230 [Leptolyngbya sp. 15MV]|nr:hypothetical protein J4558_20230 [Leptolyngbya sp. 15MV]
MTAAEEILATLMRPVDEALPRDALRRITAREARILVEDAALGRSWVLDGATLDLRRLAEGGVAGRGAGTFLLGNARLPVSLAVEAKGEPAVIGFRAALSETRPAALAALAPALAPLRALDAPATLELSGRLDADGALATLETRLTARGGALDLGEGRRVPIAALDLRGALRGDALAVERATLRLDGAGAPTLTGRATARRGDAGWEGRAELALDAAPIAGLARWWPEGLGGNERAWITQNITAGTARQGQWTFAATAPADLSSVTLTAVEGALQVEDATVHWLRPIPPVEGVRGTVAFARDSVTARVAAARQSGTQVQAREAEIRIGFPDGAVPTAEIQLPLAGPLPDVLALLQHPRLRLFERRPLPLKEPAGALDGRLALSFPLLNDLPVEQLRVRAQARLGNVRLADVVLGRPIERGQFDLTVDNDGLRLAGTATFAEIALRLGVEMDFRAGPPTQVTMRETVQARAEARQLAALDLAHEVCARVPASGRRRQPNVYAPRPYAASSAVTASRSARSASGPPCHAIRPFSIA